MVREERKEKRDKIKSESMTGNDIGDEGAKALSEALKANTTLTYLNIQSQGSRKSNK